MPAAEDARGDRMSGIVHGLLGVPPGLAYTIIVLLVFAEAAVFVGFVLPGETAVLLGGAMAAAGRLSLPTLAVLVVVAAIAGDSVGFEVGRRFGPRILASKVLRKHAGKIAGAQTQLRERGGSAVLIGRFTAFLRAVMPGLAGASRMPYRRFLVFNAAGGLVWGGGVLLLGYSAGASYAKVEQDLGKGTAVAAALLLLAVVGIWLRRRHLDARASVHDRDHEVASG